MYVSRHANRATVVGDGNDATRGATNTAPISLVDTYATIAEIIGVSLPDLRRGEKGAEDSISVLKAWRGGDLSGRFPMFFNDHKESACRTRVRWCRRGATAGGTRGGATAAEMAPALRAWSVLQTRGVLGRYVEADDLVQEVCFQAYRSFARYDPARGTFRRSVPARQIGRSSTAVAPRRVCGRRADSRDAVHYTTCRRE